MVHANQLFIMIQQPKNAQLVGQMLIYAMLPQYLVLTQVLMNAKNLMLPVFISKPQRDALLQQQQISAKL